MGLKLQVKICHKLIYKYHVCYGVKFTGTLRLLETLTLGKSKIRPISLTCHEGTEGSKGVALLFL
jgi:hypothetical protein